MIILPLSWTDVLSGITLSFTRAIGDFGTTLIVACMNPNQTMTIPIAIYDALITGNKQLANILVFIMTLIAIIIFVITRLEKRGY